jgi:AraC-like DNA-binding protein
METLHIDKATIYIKDHLTSEFSLKDIALYVGYSPSHFAREFCNQTGISVMDYVRNERISAAANRIVFGEKIFDVAMDYCFDTHAGFTKAFLRIYGCNPQQYREHKNKLYKKEDFNMQNSEIVIRPICKDDVNDLWENVYSAMIPNEITNIKITPSIEGYKKKEIIHLIAEVEGKVVSALPLMRMFNHPVGFLFDNNYILSHTNDDIIMEKLLDEMKIQAKEFGMNTLEMWEPENSEYSETFISLGFQKVYVSGGFDYLMMSI